MKNYDIEKKWKHEVEINKYYKLQTDRLKHRKFIYSSLPIVSKYSVDINDMRSFVYSDIYTRYLMYKGYNCLFPIGLNNTSENLYNNVSKNILSKDDPYTNLKENSYIDLNNMDICCDFDRKLESHNKDFIFFMQTSFSNLLTSGFIFKDDTYYLDFKEIKDEVVKQLVYNDKFDSLKGYLGYEVGVEIEFKTSCNNTIKSLVKTPELLFGVNAICIKSNSSNLKKYIANDEKEYISKTLKSKKCIGVFSGNYAINPINNFEIPIIISNYFDEEFTIINPNNNDKELLFSSVLGLGYINIINFKQGEKTLNNSGFLDDMNVEEARGEVIKFLLENDFATYYEDIKTTKLELSTKYSYGISLPLFEDSLVEVDDYPVLVDRKNNVRTLNGKLSNKKIIDQVFNTNITQAFLTVATRVKSKIGITNFSMQEFLTDFNDYLIFDHAIFTSNEEYLYALILNLIICKYVGIENKEVFKKVSILGKFYDGIGRELLRENNNLIELNSILERYGACSLRFSMLKTNVEDNYYYTQDDFSIFSTVINRFMEIYNSPFLTEYKELEIDYNQLLNNCTKCIEDNNLNLYLKYLNEFIDNISRDKKISLKQAKGLLILFSLVSPSICEMIYKDIFGSNYPLMFESWPI